MDQNITASIVADTVSRAGVRITTLEVQYPRIILAEVNTHRLISKSSASSRAIPLSVRLKNMAEGTTYCPQFDGAVANKPGMQSTEKLADGMASAAKMIWDEAVENAMESAQQLGSTGVHKQFANRLLEPFIYQRSVLTATEWDNYFDLRDHPDAQPEFIELARAMKAAMEHSRPEKALIVDSMDVHLPYYSVAIDGDIRDVMAASGPRDGLVGAYLVSSARCARVSYRSNKTGKRSTRDEDFTLAEDLVKRGHMSPFDHAAIGDTITEKFSATYWTAPEQHRQFYGWIPYRVHVEENTGRQGRRSSFGEIKISDLR